MLLYIRHRLSIHYNQSKPKASAPPPSAPSVPSPLPAPRSAVEFRIDLLASQESQALGDSGREPKEPFTLHVS